MSASKQFPKFYKVILNSQHARYSNGEFTWEVTLPLYDNLHTKVGWILGVESFYTSDVPNGVLEVGQGGYANLHLRELTQIASFSSDRKANTDVILTLNSTYVKNNLVTNSIGIPITDEHFFVNKCLTMYFSNEDMVKMIEPQAMPFQVTLLIWKAYE